MPTTLHLPTDIDLSAFISKEAHDLKSPFNRVLGFTKLVLKGMDGPISDQAKEDLNTAYQNSLYAFIFMSGLVEMARLSRAERKLTLVSCPVEAVLRQVVLDWKKQCPKEKPVEVAFKAPECSIKADEAMIRQELLNWISYVVEFAQESTQVDIEVQEQADECLFTVRSTGKKLQPPPECDLTLYGYIAMQLLELHHGKLVCAEEDEQGARVQFALPKA